MYSFSVTSFDDWRTAARALLHANIQPSSVSWQSPEQQGLFGGSSIEEVIAQTHSSGKNQALKIPRDFLARAKLVACFSDKKEPAKKWSILYSLLWRLKQQGKNVLDLNSDAEVAYLNSACKAVSRDQHKMKAFVRFQHVVSNTASPPEYAPPEDGHEHYVAWFEPSHAIVESVAPFFVKRFTGMKWSIMTPQGCAHWDMDQLTLSEGVLKPENSADVFEVFWKAYYCNIFNPARLKEQAMISEMPKKYWKHLPEAACIQGLTRGAAATTEKMLEAPVTNSNRARDKSRVITHFQDQLRSNNGANGTGDTVPETR